MSRFTSTPFHKPSPFDVPRPVHPLSPPDTDSDIMGPAQQSSISITVGGDADSATIPIAAPVETPASRFRKISTLAYLNSGLSSSGRAEAREKVTPRTKWLVVIVPPSTFPQEPGHLGHTLSSGPPNRLSSGLLMPLFPTMYGQLTAIAKEFNFPSTTGLCLYLHVTESGFTFTPRISDESWQLLWGHLFEARSPVTSSPQLPISGRIEFDVDLRKARWYDAWIATSQRDVYEVPVSVPVSRAPSISHHRDDSRTTFADEGALDDQVEAESVTQTRTMRHVPRKLSLLDRFDTYSMRLSSRPPSNAEISPKQDHPGQRVSNTLSPIVQEDEPKSAKKDLESRVRSWRASSSVAPTPLTQTGQFSLDPVNMPNTVSLDSPVVEQGEDEGEYELNLDDFTWSISSAGPEEFEYDVESIMSYRAPSVHLDRRVEGSVCLTPSVATSLGPEDYDYMYSPVSNASRLPSPDLGRRVLESVPPTPSTATSWGPVDCDYLYSPMSNVSRLPSPDLGRRCLSSVPPTPSTATSWGPESYPASPLSDVYAQSIQSVDIGQRNGGWSRPNTPSTATSWGPFDSYPPSPATPYYVRTPDVGQRTFDPQSLELSATRLQFPYYDPWQGTPWRHVWPYTQRRQQGRPTPITTVSEADKPPRSAFGFPYYKASPGEPWGGVWPYRAEGERAMSGISVRLGAAYPSFDLYPAVYPHLEVYPSKLSDNGEDVSVALSASYPTFSIYPAVYPYMEIYPGHVSVDTANKVQQGETARQKKVKQEKVVRNKEEARAKYSASGINYPSFEIYPGHVCGVDQSTSLVVTLTAVYPALVIYSSVYPYLEIYPNCIRSTGSSKARMAPIARTWASPNISAGVYPHLEIYPNLGVKQSVNQRLITVTLESRYPALSIYRAAYPHMEIYTGHIHDMKSEQPMVVVLPPAYPIFDIYPAVYPQNLISIYPARPARRSLVKANSNVVGHYPHFDLYPAKYDVYRDEGYYKARPVQLKAAYPAFDLYPVSYPYMNIYPVASGPVHATQSSPRRSGVKTLPGIIVRLAAVYPPFDLYPAQYPVMNIYPSIQAPEKKSQRQTSVVIYPSLLIYPAVYPYFDIYPTHTPVMNEEVGPMKLAPQYPVISLYAATYPFFEVYPGVVCAGDLKTLVNVSSRLLLRYPAIRTYEPVYPHFDLYPGPSCASLSASPSSRRRQRTHAELHASVVKSKGLRQDVGEGTRTHKTHSQLYDEVFPVLQRDGSVSPSETHRHKIDPETSRRKVSFAPDTVVEAPPRPLSRSRSGTVNTRSNIPPVPLIPPQYVSKPLPTPKPSSIRGVSRSVGLPSHPAQHARPISTVFDTEMDRVRGTSLSPVAESPRLSPSSRVARAKSMITTGISPQESSTLDRSNSLSNPVRKPVRSRDSFISERMKTFDNSSSTSSSERSDPETPSLRVSLNTLSQFPMPPAPALPTGRPVSKLDRSKYPFA